MQAPMVAVSVVASTLPHLASLFIPNGRFHDDFVANPSRGVIFSAKEI